MASESYIPEVFVDRMTATKVKQTKHSSRVLVSTVAIVDCVADFLAGACSFAVACTFVTAGSGSIDSLLHRIIALSTIIGITVAVLLHWNHPTSRYLGPRGIGETAQAIRISAQAFFILVPAMLLLKMQVPVAVFALSFTILPFVLFLKKRTLLTTIYHLSKHGHGLDRVVIYGTGSTSERIALAMLHSQQLTCFPVAILDPHAASANQDGTELPGRDSYPKRIPISLLTAEDLRSLRPDILLIAEHLPSHQLEPLRVLADDAGARFAYLSEGLRETTALAHHTQIGDVLVIQESKRAEHWHYACGKRILDIVISSLLLTVLSPLFLFLALIIRLTSRGPALFIQQRVGRDGALFRMYKFRSMLSTAPQYECSPTSSYDPRITPVGRFLRRTSLDELPQLINVFLGQMSLVGPRPEMPFIAQSYTTHQRQRLQVAPGLTGLWQLSDDRAHAIHENLHHDFAYIRNRDLALDMAILIHTLFFAMRGGI